MKVEIKYSNMLMVDGEYLDFRYPGAAGLLDEVLKGQKTRYVINNAIEVMYREQVKKNPNANVKKGSIWLGVLATKKTFKVTEEGMYQLHESQEDRGVITKKEHLDSVYHGLWDIVTNRGFDPETRFSSYGKNETVDLLLKQKSQ